MVKSSLQIQATLENIAEMKTCYPDYSFFIQIQCTNCGESLATYHDVTQSEKTEKAHSRADGANFSMKCKLCSREIFVDIVEKSNASYMEADSGKYKAIVTFDCRGGEPVGFDPRSGWIIKASNDGPTFEDIDLSEDDWVEYDQKNNQSIGVYEFKSKFVKVK